MNGEETATAQLGNVRRICGDWRLLLWDSTNLQCAINFAIAGGVRRCLARSSKYFCCPKAYA